MIGACVWGFDVEYYLHNCTLTVDVGDGGGDD